jgi:hypothetical protein
MSGSEIQEDVHSIVYHDHFGDLVHKPRTSFILIFFFDAKQLVGGVSTEDKLNQGTPLIKRVN